MLPFRINRQILELNESILRANMACACIEKKKVEKKERRKKRKKRRKVKV